VSNSRQIQNIALIGFMGTGKSSVGQVLAHQLGFTFLDTDQLIETSEGRTISRIFEEDGEPSFRALEAGITRNLEHLRHHVISTGGGLPVNPDNLASLKSHALVVCLWASPEKIWERVRHQAHRPLLHDPDPLGRIRTLLSAREPAYRLADVLINTELRSVKEVVQQVMHHYSMAHPEHSWNRET